jgi:hypothetical protein
MADIYYFTTVPLSIGKLQPGDVLDDNKGYPTFEAAKAALIKELEHDIATYGLWVPNKQRDVLKVRQQKGPFDRL